MSEAARFDGCWSASGSKRGKNSKRPGCRFHDDLVQRNFAADACVWPTSSSKGERVQASTSVRSRTCPPTGSWTTAGSRAWSPTPSSPSRTGPRLVRRSPRRTEFGYRYLANGLAAIAWRLKHVPPVDLAVRNGSVRNWARGRARRARVPRLGKFLRLVRDSRLRGGIGETHNRQYRRSMP